MSLKNNPPAPSSLFQVGQRQKDYLLNIRRQDLLYAREFSVIYI
ncbi:hypothetical protein BACCOPRO_01914 [Phocaeicola coprophilus DSM 18228 = JCM 13818]|uniref:Uncharacterized protein n=1 Tax=Phocaeicola coprophilus DSM 18228 = JCM 13818 TaxID=547042 RepID=S0F7R3_9BACT|nr:hypothetical protein BACCOPRO_01914 [Phocaeicola coprophilus DSM 18228 = JCM 13818]